MNNENKELFEKENLEKENKEILEKLAFALPIFQVMLNYEVGVALADTEKFLLYNPAKDLDLKDRPGYPLKEGTGIYRVVHEKLPYLRSRPDKKLFGVSFISNAGAVFNSRGEVIGAISITQSVNREEAVREMAENLLKNISVLASTSEEITAESQEMAAITRTLAKMAEESHQRVNETDSVLEFINGIAKQTNLLGLNAAIEAARVGEMGRGFGVVADEIRKLASSSTESITKIREIITAIQNDSIKTKESIERVDGGISQMAEAITQVATAIEELHRMADLLYQKADMF